MRTCKRLVTQSGFTSVFVCYEVCVDKTVTLSVSSSDPEEMSWEVIDGK